MAAMAQSPGHRLFFGLFPDGATAQRIHALAGTLAHEGERPSAADRLHVTLRFLGDFDSAEPPFVQAAMQAAATAATGGPPFEVTFDRVASFRNRDQGVPLVLLGGEALKTLKEFRGALDRHLGSVKLIQPKGDYTPHVTLLYGEPRVEERPIAPITWRAEEFRLVHSTTGRAQYTALGRWRLSY